MGPLSPFFRVRMLDWHDGGKITSFGVYVGAGRKKEHPRRGALCDSTSPWYERCGARRRGWGGLGRRGGEMRNVNKPGIRVNKPSKQGSAASHRRLRATGQAVRRALDVCTRGARATAHRSCFTEALERAHRVGVARCASNGVVTEGAMQGARRLGSVHGPRATIVHGRPQEISQRERVLLQAPSTPPARSHSSAQRVPSLSIARSPSSLRRRIASSRCAAPSRLPLPRLCLPSVESCLPPPHHAHSSHSLPHHSLHASL
ncbi:hypothetical protein T440DRAFT_110141 [Plenodomus tracheiphilus IPT5]|uniref:Uncharacterized protein n=1 Tax=Plenodomus tracheiphilus IPT5 TaxID=1408161 RepID=A0A6A7B458_9PLEO|nr:hypothetical protein T440DRAFT_110141 [Plenodomus tracheiphilus IPT5]